MTVKDVYQAIERIAPFATQMDFDNAGLLIGNPEQPVTAIGVVLDVTPEAIRYAAENGIDCIVSHHPVIFSGLKSVDSESVVYQAIQKGIAVLSAHTNYDAAHGGVNDVLAQALGLTQVQPLAFFGDTTPPMGRIGCLPKEMTDREFAEFVGTTLSTRVKFVSVDKKISRVAVCGGAGSELMEPAIQAGADALVTAEVKHHQLLEAKKCGFMLMDGGHFETEQVAVWPLAERLEGELSLPVRVIPQTSPVCYC